MFLQKASKIIDDYVPEWKNPTSDTAINVPSVVTFKDRWKVTCPNRV